MAEAMKSSMEPLFQQYQVNVAYSGHVHGEWNLFSLSSDSLRIACFLLADPFNVF